MSVKAVAVAQDDLPYIKFTKSKSITVISDTKDEKTFGFDGAFRSTDINGLYKSSCSSLVQEALSGHNVNVTCCGLTDTGSSQALRGSGVSAVNGIIPSAIKDLFQKVNGGQFLISASMLQIDEGGGMTDILNPHSRRLRVKKNPKLGIIVENLTAYVVSNVDQACSLYSEGSKTETGLKTPHRDIIFTLSIYQKQQDLASSGILSKITFVDLVGHEMESDNTGIKALFKSLSKGKIRDQSSNTDMIVADAIMNSKAIVIACVAGQESHPANAMRLFDLVKSASGIRTSPRKNTADLSKSLAQVRNEIKTFRERIVQESIPYKQSVEQLETLIADLNDLKNTSWDRIIAHSNLCTDERKSNLANRGLLWVLESGSASNQDEIKALQQRISEMSAKMKEQKESAEKLKEDLKSEIESYGKSVKDMTDEQTKTKVGRIQSMKETFKRENESLTKSREALKQAKEQLRKQKEAGLDVASFNFEMTVRKLQEDRSRMKKENEQIVNDEVEKMKIEVAHERAVLDMTASSGGLRLDEDEQLKQSIELATLKLEKSTITTQLDALRKEKRQMEDHIGILAEKHTKQMEIQQLQNLQTFRAYREVFEEFKADLDNRWRGLLDDAIQDAVFLNSRNSELTQENKRLDLEVKQLKDALSLTGTPLPGKPLKNV